MCKTLKPLQLTLAVLKPDVVSHPHVQEEIINSILAAGFYIIRSQRLRLSRTKAEAFYKEHEGRFFHNRLVSFMSSGDIVSQILARENAISEWRKLMGPTKVFRTVHSDPESVRGRFGLTDTRNCTHGSDSEDNARKEINFFFPDFDIDGWYSSEEKFFRKASVEFSQEKGIHILTDRVKEIFN